MIKIILLLGLASGLMFIQCKEKNNWQGITPLLTKRAEVEALLGSPTFGTGYILSYDTQSERITIWYGGAKPAKENPCRWNVSPDTVLHFILAPKKKLLLSEVKLDLKKFEKREDLEVKGAFYYFNEEDGITITTRVREGEEVVESINYNPKLEDRKKSCASTQY